MDSLCVSANGRGLVGLQLTDEVPVDVEVGAFCMLRGRLLMFVFPNIVHPARHQCANQVGRMKLRDHDERRVIRIAAMRCQRLSDFLANGREPLRQGSLVNS
jgi:hypothetical protein